MDIDYKCYVAEEKNKPLKLQIKKLNKRKNKITIKIKYCGICGSDLHILKGEWGDTFPQILGHEIIGTIIDLPEQTSNFLLNDIVGVGWQESCCNKCNHCFTNKNYFCEKSNFTCLFNDQGGFAEYIQVDPSFVFKIPECSLEKLPSLAPFMCGGITAFKPLYCGWVGSTF